jgi:2-methylcitrate dehydratase PrpD
MQRTAVLTTAATLANFATDTRFEHLPPRAVDHAKVVIASTIASAAMGRDIGSAKAFREMARERGGTPDATLWFDGGPKLPVMDAARTNAIMSDSAASDDSDLAAHAHLGTVTSTAAIAMGERQRASGRDVLAAIVVGYEIGNRIGKHIKPAEVGFHPGVITIFSATVAAGKLMKLKAEQMTQAIALAATSIGGSRAAADLSCAREYDAALSSMLAVTAAMAASKGFTTETNIMEMPRGYFEVFKGHDLEGVTRGLGDSWGIVDDLAIKLMPGGWINHALAEAAWTCAAKGDIKPDEVERIAVQTRRSVRHLLYHPTDLTGVAHSLPYMVAASVVDRTYSWQHVTPAKFSDAVIGALQDKVVATDEPSPYANRGGGTVTITTKNGRSYSQTFEAPRGSGPRGIEWADIRGKYRALTPMGGLSQQTIDQSLDIVQRFEEAQSVSVLTDLLRE